MKECKYCTFFNPFNKGGECKKFQCRISYVKKCLLVLRGQIEINTLKNYALEVIAGVVITKEKK